MWVCVDGMAVEIVGKSLEQLVEELGAARKRENRMRVPIRGGLGVLLVPPEATIVILDEVPEGFTVLT